MQNSLSTQDVKWSAQEYMSAWHRLARGSLEASVPRKLRVRLYPTKELCQNRGFQNTALHFQNTGKAARASPA